MKMRSVVSAMLALSLACLPLLTQAEEEIPTIVTVVPAPDQTKAERPACFPDPADQYIALPETENFALNKEVISGAHTDVYVSRNVNDGKTDTYWESKGFPAEMLIVLGETHTISTVAVCLNPSAIWEARIQEIAVFVSQDGENFTEVAPSVSPPKHYPNFHPPRSTNSTLRRAIASALISIVWKPVLSRLCSP